LFTELCDVGVADGFLCWAWLERSPCPAWCVIQCLPADFSEFAVLIALTHVANPSPESNEFVAFILDVSCRNERVALSGDVLL